MNYKTKFYIALGLSFLASALIFENAMQMGGFGGANVEAIVKTVLGVVVIAIAGPLAHYYYSRSRQPKTPEQIEIEMLDKQKGDNEK